MSQAILLHTIALILMCSAGSRANGSEAQGWQSLIDTLSRIRTEGHVPAMGLVILDDGKPVVVKTFGHAQRATPFRWGSISKSFTALGALRLVELELISLDTAISKILPDTYYANAWADTAPVRLIHLLELSAGFGDLTGAEFNDNEPLSLQAALRNHADERTTRWPPGLQHSYTNVAPGLTAAVIEQTSGQSFERYMVEQILRPMQMPNASFLPVDDLPGGYRSDGTTEIPYWHTTFRAFGGLNASIEEMSNFLQVLLNQGQLNDQQIFSKATIARAFTPTTTLGVENGLRIAYASGIYGWVRNGFEFWGHGGDADGYRSRYGILRDHSRAYLLVINTDNPKLLQRLRVAVESALTRGLEKPIATSELKTQLKTQLKTEGNSENLLIYTGTYYPSSARFALQRWENGEAQTATVSVAGNRLRFTRGKRTELLYPLGEGRFRRSQDPRTSVVFARSPDGLMYLQGELGNFLNQSNGFCPGFIHSCLTQ